MLEPRVLPAAGQRLADAFTRLMKEKDFNSITTAEIANTAQANEALIYRYFGDKRGLLHHVFAESFKEALTRLLKDLNGNLDVREKIEKLISWAFSFYNNDLVVARILLLEVRSFPKYFQSEAYELVRAYARLLLVIIQKGQEEGLLSPAIPAETIRDIIFGGIEHLFVPKIIFGRPCDVDAATRDLCAVVFDGILKRDGDTHMGRQHRKTSRIRSRVNWKTPKS